MSPSIRRLTAELSRRLSAWLLQSYRRPVGLFIGLLVVPLGLVFAATYRFNVSLWRGQTLHNLGVAARLGTEIVSETLDSTLDFERILAGEPAFIDAVSQGDTAQVTHYLQEALQYVRRADGAVVTSPDGTVMAAHPSREGLVGSDAPGQTVLPEPAAGDPVPRISGVYLRDGPEIEKVVGVVMPIMQGERLVGLLQIQHRIEAIKSWLQKIRVEPEGFLYVVDQLDQLAVFPYQTVPGEPMVVSAWPPVAQPVGPNGATLAFTNARSGKRWLAAVHLVGESGWRVVTVQREGAALGTLHRVFLVLGLLVALLAALVGVVGWRWLQVHAFSLRLLQQNAEVLKQLQQARLLERGRRPDDAG